MTAYPYHRATIDRHKAFAAIRPLQTWALTLFVTIQRAAVVIALWRERARSRRQLLRLNDAELKDVSLLSDAGSISYGRMRSRQVSVGDGFTKVGGFSRAVYVVRSIVEEDGFPPHVRLSPDGEPGDGMLMSISALQDRSLWLRVLPEKAS